MWQTGQIALKLIHKTNDLTIVLKSCCVTISEDTFVVIGGSFGTKQVLSYNENTKKWTHWKDLPVDRQDHACIKENDSILVTGGYTNRTQTMRIDLDRETQIFSGNLNKGRYCHNMAILNGKIVAIGGAPATNTIEEWDGAEWKTLETTLKSSYRYNFAVVSFP